VDEAGEMDVDEELCGRVFVGMGGGGRRGAAIFGRGWGW
jgi:hypothetical protein